MCVCVYVSVLKIFINVMRLQHRLQNPFFFVVVVVGVRCIKWMYGICVCVFFYEFQDKRLHSVCSFARRNLKENTSNSTFLMRIHKYWCTRAIAIFYPPAMRKSNAKKAHTLSFTSKEQQRNKASNNNNKNNKRPSMKSMHKKKYWSIDDSIFIGRLLLCVFGFPPCLSL